MAVTYYDDDAAEATYTNGTGVWTEGTAGDWYRGKLHYSDGVRNRLQKVTWNITITAGAYDVWLTWVASAAYAADAPYVVKDGGSTLGSGTLNFQNSPSDLTADGANWFYLGRFTWAGTTMTLEWTDLLVTVEDKFIVSDGVRIDGPISSGSAFQSRRLGRSVIGSTGVRIY